MVESRPTPSAVQNRTQGTVESRPLPSLTQAIFGTTSLLGGDRPPVRHSCVVTATTAVVSWSKVAKPGRIKVKLPSCPPQQIDRYIPGICHTCVYLCNSHTAVGAWCHFHLACYMFQYTSCWHYCRKTREHYSIPHITSWNVWLGRTTARLR